MCLYPTYQRLSLQLCVAKSLCFFSRVFVVHDVSLSYSSVPYKGVVQIITDSGTKNVCWQSLQNQARRIVCRHLGYTWSYSFHSVSIPTDAKDATFSGSINCNGEEKYLSQCSINASASETCSGLSYIDCIPGGKIYKTR